jgi:hypothetical protein
VLVAFSGLKGSGKDTAASVLIEQYGFTKVAFADAVREMALIIDPIVIVPEGVSRLSALVEHYGWDLVKREIPEIRRLLQVIGTEAGRNFYGENVWVDIVDKRFPDMAHPATRYVVTDCRFVNEAKFVEKIGGAIVWIERPGVESDGHASESRDVFPYRDYEIWNDSDIAHVESEVHAIMEREGIERRGLAETLSATD